MLATSYTSEPTSLLAPNTLEHKCLTTAPPHNCTGRHHLCDCTHAPGCAHTFASEPQSCHLWYRWPSIAAIYVSHLRNRWQLHVIQQGLIPIIRHLHVCIAALDALAHIAARATLAAHLKGQKVHLLVAHFKAPAD